MQTRAPGRVRETTLSTSWQQARKSEQLLLWPSMPAFSRTHSIGGRWVTSILTGILALLLECP